MLKSLKQFGKRTARSFGYDIRRFTPPSPAQVSAKQNYPLTLGDGLARSKMRGIEIATVIDVGASDGRWSEICLQYFPAVFHFLIEANSVHQAGLERFKESHPHSDFLLAAAGDTEGAAYFGAGDPLGGSASHTQHTAQTQMVPLTTLDIQVRERNLAPPFLIKLDTHGFEREILDGATETIAQSELLIIEAYNFVKDPASLRFHQLCSYLEARNFRSIDIIEPFFQPQDQAFWQMDIIFIRADHPSFSSNSFKYDPTLLST